MTAGEELLMRQGQTGTGVDKICESTGGRDGKCCVKLHVQRREGKRQQQGKSDEGVEDEKGRGVDEICKRTEGEMWLIGQNCKNNLCRILHKLRYFKGNLAWRVKVAHFPQLCEKENVLKIGHLELIQLWYLCPGFYGSYGTGAILIFLDP